MMAEERVYPSPTLVAGVGRLGLGVLERLGEDWQTLRLSGGGATLGNLRLLHIAPETDDETPWRAQERATTRLARHVGDSDLPSLAVNLLILRSLGLVRYRDGCYQVALPRDAGVADLVGDSGEVGVGGQGPLRRRRYFEWLSLSPDPVTAVERLCRHAERTSELDLFITPIVNRVRQGHSPRALLACIGRCHAMACGRDPSPWAWVATLVRQLGVAEGAVDLELTPDDPRAPDLLGLEPDDMAASPHHRALGLLDHYAPSPLVGWRRWLGARHGPAEGPVEGPALGLHVPPPFVPRADDPELWLDPLELLRVDWETSGWATDEGGGEERVVFEPVAASPFRLGLFDHDGTATAERGEGLVGRLRVFADLARRGLVRLWIDLQRDRVEEGSALVLVGDRHRESADEALRQSLEVLGELLVRPLAKDEPIGADEPVGTDEPVSGRKAPSPAEPSPQLVALRMPEDDAEGDAEGDVEGDVAQRLDRRLAALGLGRAGEGKGAPPLLRQVRLGPDDVDRGPLSGATGALSDGADPVARGGLTRLGQALNRQVRELLHIRHLGRYRHRPIRRPPRVTLYLVGDMGEPFVRATLRSVLREIHAELLRAFSPIFEHYREGFDRSLSIVPILWMPHPADPFEGRRGPASRRREEESAVIDAIQGIRRWVESVIPASRRRVSQIFVNSRVTDTAVLDTDDAIRQTRDFVTFQSRNAIGADEWLRRSATGPTGDDFFSSFACYEVAFPAEKVREVLANRLGRELLHQLERGPGEHGLTEAKTDRPSLGLLAVAPKTLEPPATPELLRGAGAWIAGRTTEAADQLAERVEGRTRVAAERRADQLAADFDDGFGRQLLAEIRRVWGRLVERQGEVDAQVDGLRQRVGELLARTLAEVRRQGDEWIGQLVGELGLGAARSGFAERRLLARGLLTTADERRRRHEAACLRHRIPETSGLEGARRAVVEAARAKPDLGPMRWGFVVWLGLAPVLGAPLGLALGRWLAPWAGPAVAPWLDHLAPWSGGLLVALGGAYFLVATMDRGLTRVEAAIEGLVGHCRLVVAGDAGDGAVVDSAADSVVDSMADGSPSIRSFFDTRLRLTSSLAARGFSLGVFEQAATDAELADRLGRSVEAQRAGLARRAEELGVRPSPDPREGERLGGVFVRRLGGRFEGLVSPEALVRHFEQRSSHGAERGALARQLLAAAGGFEGWRVSAPLADAEAILAFGREHFHTLAGPELARCHPFTDEAGRRLLDFVVRCYPNIGFGARFLGSEGLDPDGVDLLAEAALVLHPDLARLFERATKEPGAPATTRTLQVMPCGVRPGAAYMLSLAQGIRPHTVRNLRRFESFYDRTSLPEDRTFPLSGDDGEKGSLNHLSAYGSLAERLGQPFGLVPGSVESGEPDAG